MKSDIYCPGSRILSESSSYYSIGSVVERKLRLLKKRHLGKFYFSLLSLTAIGSGIAIGLCENFPKLGIWSSGLSLAFLFFWFLPRSLVMGIQSSPSFIFKILHPDTVIAIAITVALVLDIASIRSFSWTAKFQIGIDLALVAWLWLVYRIYESFRFRSRFPALDDKIYPLERGLLFVSLRKIQLFQILIGLGLFCSTYWLQHWLEPERPMRFAVILSLALVATPTTWLLASRLLRLSASAKIQIGDFSKLRKFAQTSSIRSHYLGVLAEPELATAKQWYDPSSAWSEQELQAFTKGMAQNSLHPICRAVYRTLPSTEAMDIRLSEIIERPHIGLQTRMRNESGKDLDVILGNPSWMKLQEFDFSPEAQRLLVDEDRLGVQILALAINQRLVGLYFFQAEVKAGAAKEIQELKKMGREIVVISSGASKKLSENSYNLDDLAQNLSPLERKLQKEFWFDRKSEFIELRADWDPEPDAWEYQNVNRICFRQDLSFSIKDEIQIWGDGVKGLGFLFKELALWEGRLIWAFVIVLLGIIALQAFQSLWIGLLIFYLTQALVLEFCLGRSAA
ncbi:MAG: hypothetical protein COV44_02420 [Deltaproteobacteria bacterium CG11_big_fil_rev_8_21_14_0_20_45_16]|nr:MAG: hypothetical protein COV44_02420 [Deltaproteobacteria bacterium CG11_big_fil_rev_8_21_14_0_20_45_16]